MKSIEKHILSCAVLASFFFSAIAFGAVEFYVAPDGDDANAGTIDAPFATLAHAKQAVHDLIVGEGLTDDVEVILRGGNYYLSETLSFGAEDSGTADHTVTYRSYLGEEVHIIGGIEFPSDWFTQLDDTSPYSPRLKAVDDPNVVYMADLAAHDITDYGQLANRGAPWDGQTGPMELFVNYQPMQLGRWPNNSYEMAYIYYLAGLTDKQLYYYYNYYTYDGEEEESGYNRPARWSQATDKLIHGYFDSYQKDVIVPFDVDTNYLVITLPSDSNVSMDWEWIEDPYTYEYSLNNNVYPVFYFMNLLEEIDQPGEYYLDRKTGKLFLYPPEDFSDATCQLSMIDTMLEFNGASHIQFEGLIMEVCRRNIAQITDGDSIRFYRCTFRDAGTDAASIEGIDCGLDSCAVYDNGDGGVNLTGGDRTTLTAGNDYLRNSHVHDLSRWGHNANPAAYMSDSCKMIASHNLIDNLPGSAIVSSRCNDNIIGYNTIHDVCWQTDDNAAIYLDRYWTARGTDIFYNFLYDIASNPIDDEETSNGVWPFVKSWSSDWMKRNDGICLDTAASDNRIHSNILYNIQRHGVTINGGRNNNIYSNIFAYFEYSAVYLNRLFNCDEYADERSAAIDMLHDFDYLNPPWSEHYPLLTNDLLLDEPNEPKYNLLTRNIGYENDGELAYEGSSCDDEEETHFLIQADNAYAEFPLFVDEPNLIMNLLPGSVVEDVTGWRAIPFDQIGMVPVVDELAITLVDCNNVEVRGSCPPWAHVNEVIASVPKAAGSDNFDATEYITVLDNGAIYGRIPKALFGNQAGIWLNVSDPQGHVSEWKASAQINFLPLHNNAAWPEEISVQAGQTIDIALPVSSTGVEMTLTGLPETAYLNESGHLIWQTTLADASDTAYIADIILTKGNTQDCDSIKIFISDTPLEPQIELSIQECGFYTITGQCDPWATISTAVIHETGTDISDKIDIDPNTGNISGTIAKDFDPNTVSMQIELVLEGPRGSLSPMGISNRLTPATLVAAGDWPDVITLAADKILDKTIPASLSSGAGLEYVAIGLPEDATIDNQGHLYWATDINDVGEYFITLSIYDGDSFECNSFVIDVTDEPDPPVLQLSMQNSDYYAVSGSCAAWATVAKAIIVETGQSYRPNIKINPETGTITGLIPKLQIQSDDVTLEVVLKGPNGTLSQPGQSNTFNYTKLVNFFIWPQDLTVRAGDLIDIPSPITSVPIGILTFSMEGLPQGASVDPATGRIFWQTTSSDSGVYPVRLIAFDGDSYDFGQFTITVNEDVIQTMTITQCVVRAKGDRGTEKDYIEASGQLAIQGTELLAIEEIHINIGSGQQSFIEGTVPFKLSEVKNGKFSYKGDSTGITSLDLDVFTGTFTVTGKQVDLTGLRTPVFIELDMGDFHGIGYAGDNIEYRESGGSIADVINGKKFIPINLYQGNTNVLQVSKVTYRSTRNFNILTVKGYISVKDPVESMTDHDVTFTWANDQGQYEVTLEKKYFSRRGNKNIFVFRAPRGQNHPVKTAQFNLDKGTFNVVIRDGAIPNLFGDVSFGVKFGSFDEKMVIFVQAKHL